MRPNSRDLAMRDPALASALGISGAGDSTYGAEPYAEFGSEWGDDGTWGSDVGLEYYGYHGGDQGFGFGFGADAPMAVANRAAPVAHPLHPAQAARTMAIVQKHDHKSRITQNRERLLHPNKGSDIDIERYDFSVPGPNFVLGTASGIGTTAATAMSIQPAVAVRPQRCTFNAPSVGMVTISAIQSANVNGLVGGSTDAGIYGPNSFGIHLDLPTLSPANKLTITGSYLGLTPPGFPVAYSFPFVASFQGPATVVA